MTEEYDSPARSWDTSVPTLVISVVAAVAVPPSGTVPGISDIEQQLASAILPLLLMAAALAVAGVVASLTRKHRWSGLFGVLSLLLVNLAGLLSGQYGVGGVGLLVTLLLTSPFAVMMARRETLWRRKEGPRFTAKS